MEIDVYKILEENLLLLTFLVIGSGYLLGRVRIGSVNVGSTTGVLLAGLFFGHLGFPDTPGAASFGFTLFIFSVGLQAGPSFFSAFAQDGLKYVVLSAVVTVSAVGMVLGLSAVIDLETGMSAGLLAGALTSTPTLAGAQDAISSGLAALPAGMSARQASANVSVGYAMTYIFGTVGLILFIRYLPRMMGVDLPGEARKLAEQRGIGVRRWTANIADSLPIIRAYRLGGRMIGKTIDEVLQEGGRRVTPLRIRRSNRMLDPDPTLVLEDGDEVSIVASLSTHRHAAGELGAEVLDPELLNYRIDAYDIVVISPEAVGKRLGDLSIVADHGCFVREVSRAAIHLPVDDDMILHKGDRLHVTGEVARLQQLANRLGYVEEQIEETDLLTFAFGVCGGILLGLILLKIGQVSVGLGSAGGLLLMGIVIGFLSSIYPTFGRVPAPARFILMELGLMIFMAMVGLRAGGSIVEAFRSVGPMLILCGMAVTLTPVIVGYAFGRKVLDLNPALLLGSLTGAMTSTPALNIVTTAARSGIPALGYAGTYTFANVLLTFAGTLMMAL